MVTWRKCWVLFCVSFIRFLMFRANLWMYRDNQKILKWVNVYINQSCDGLLCTCLYILYYTYVFVTLGLHCISLWKINSLNLSNCYAKFGYYICPWVGTFFDTFSIILLLWQLLLFHSQLTCFPLVEEEMWCTRVKQIIFRMRLLVWKRGWSI